MMRCPPARGTATYRWVAALILVTWVTREVRGHGNATGGARFFLYQLMEKYGYGGAMNTTQVDSLVSMVQGMGAGEEKGHGDGDQHAMAEEAHPGSSCTNMTSTYCLRTKKPFGFTMCVRIKRLVTCVWSGNTKLLWFIIGFTICGVEEYLFPVGAIRLDYSCPSKRLEQCMDTAAIFHYHALHVGDAANASQVAQLAPTLLYQLQNRDCYVTRRDDPHKEKRKKPSTAEMWGYGILAVTVINVCAALGVLFYPIMRTRLYKKILMAMVGLAVGSLSASAVLVLIPEALELMDEEAPMRDLYAWRMVIVLGGIYMFFTVERILEAIVASKRGKSDKRKNYDMSEKGIDNPAYDDARDTNVSNGHSHSYSVDPPRTAVCWAPLATIKPVAWMVVFGDALHNFVDGLSIGAAFSADLLAGVSLSLAVVCEELPHELGDFAVLLNSGMGICQALLMNVLSGMTCYLGLVVGIQVGALENGAIYIFALAAGMFLYISLVDMLPEMNEQAREEQSEGGCGVCVVYILQNLGLLVGWGVILLLVLYGDQISFGGVSASH